MEYTVEDYIKLIEQRRFDKIGAWAMELIAKKYRNLEQNQGQTLPIHNVSKSVNCDCEAFRIESKSAVDFCGKCGKSIL